MTQEKHKKSHGELVESAVAAGVMSIVEVNVFHPADTVQKRLMKNPNPIYNFKQSFGSNLREASYISFCNSQTGRLSLYPGLRFATAYKLVQRTYKFGLQPVVENGLQEYVLGPSNKIAAAAISGAILGAGEVAFLPLDIYKIRRQTGSLDKGFSYRAIHVTVARNTSGSGTLFGASAVLNEFFQPQNSYQKTAIDMLSAIGMLAVSNPLDVVKTRMQADKHSRGAWNTIVEIATKNPSQFGKGFLLKALTQGAKVTFFMSGKRAVEEKIAELGWFKSSSKP